MSPRLLIEAKQKDFAIKDEFNPEAWEDKFASIEPQTKKWRLANENGMKANYHLKNIHNQKKECKLNSL